MNISNDRFWIIEHDQGVVYHVLVIGLRTAVQIKPQRIKGRGRRESRPRQELCMLGWQRAEFCADGDLERPHLVVNFDVYDLRV
ncbi:UNVERIFIED_CONTAM: hypothetical protein ACS92_06920 [Bacillus cereus]